MKSTVSERKLSAVNLFIEKCRQVALKEKDEHIKQDQFKAKKKKKALASCTLSFNKNYTISLDSTFKDETR